MAGTSLLSTRNRTEENREHGWRYIVRTRRAPWVVNYDEYSVNAKLSSTQFESIHWYVCLSKKRCLCIMHLEVDMKWGGLSFAANLCTLRSKPNASAMPQLLRICRFHVIKECPAITLSRKSHSSLPISGLFLYVPKVLLHFVINVDWKHVYFNTFSYILGCWPTKWVLAELLSECVTPKMLKVCPIQFKF